MKTFHEAALSLHKENRGKLEITSKVSLGSEVDLSLAYSPGVAEPCKVISTNKQYVYDYTMKGNLVAVVTDGSAVLGLGNIGPEASLPVMEGKSILFKEFAGIDSFPICLNTNDVDEIVRTVKVLEPTFGGVNLEDIAAPNCFLIEERLKKETNIPIFHDDQHGTAIVTLAALTNALKLVGKPFKEVKVVVNGAGAAGVAIVRLLQHFHVREIIMCDSIGAIYEGRKERMNEIKSEIAEMTNKKSEKGTLKDVIKGADVFIGVSAANILTSEMVKTMKSDPIIFALANPNPEIDPNLAIEAGARVIGTGRSDFPNQINNVLAFPGLFRGALDVRATDINEEMKAAAVRAIASLVSEQELSEDHIIPSPFDKRVVPTVAEYVAKAAVASGVAQLTESIKV